MSGCGCRGLTGGAERPNRVWELPEPVARSSWAANATLIASGSASHRRVEHSMSVNWKVTVPDCRTVTTSPRAPRERVGSPRARSAQPRLGPWPRRPRRDRRTPLNRAPPVTDRPPSPARAREILPAATTAKVAQLPRLYTAAAFCADGRPEAGAEYSRTALRLAGDARYDPFDPAFTRAFAGTAEFFVDGNIDRYVTLYTGLAEQAGLGHVLGLALLLNILPAAGRAEEARAIAPEALTVARTHANPFWIASALIGAGRAFADTDPARALDALRQALTLSQEQRIPYWEARAAQVAANLETLHGDPEKGLDLFAAVITSYHLAGNHTDLATSLAGLAVYFDRAGQPETAATLYGTTSSYPATARVPNLAATVEHLRTLLGPTVFDEHVAAGASMEQGDAVAYARQQIRTACAGLAAPS